MTIDRFTGKYQFLSNFSPSLIIIDGIGCPTAEHAYQMLKVDPTCPEMGYWRARIASSPTARMAKTAGRAAPLRPDWEASRIGHMERVLWIKFANLALAAQLTATGSEFLVEGNTWHDQFWGDCSCAEHASVPGRNALGVLLMRVRLGLP